MIEKNPFTEQRRELSRGIFALYPEWSSIFSDKEFERRLADRFRITEKDYRLSLSGSPNHGDQYWMYEGASPLFSISTSQGASADIKRETWVRIDDLMKSLRTDTIALFSPKAVRDAQNIFALPKAFRNDLARLEDCVAKDRQNGIILVRP